MRTVSEIAANLADMHESAVKISELIVAEDAKNAELKTQIDAAVAKMAVDQAAKDALQGDIDNLWQQSEDEKNELRALVPGVPPVGGTALPSSFPGPSGEADFRAAAALYAGPEAVTLNGNPIFTANTDPSSGTLDYFSHSADGSVNTSGPSD